MTNLEELRCRVRKLLALLDDPHPGLMTWQESYSQALETVAVWWETPEQRAAAVQQAVDAERESIVSGIYSGNPSCSIAARIRARIGQPGALEAARREGREAGLRQALKLIFPFDAIGEVATAYLIEQLEHLISEEQPK